MCTKLAAETLVLTRGTQRKTSAWKRQIAIISRWLHLYLSMVSFGIVLFFAVTGLTLNHADWFNGQVRTTQYKGKLEQRWLRPDVAKLEIVEYLRRAHQVKSGVSEFRIEDSQCVVSFKGPGYSADSFIDRSGGSYELTVTRMGLGAVMNDLHKGRDSGTVWAGLIDGSAVLMTLVSVTGLALIFFLPKRRAAGLLALSIGASLCGLVYWIWVP